VTHHGTHEREALAQVSRYPLFMSQHHGSVATIARLLREIEALLKHQSVTVELGHRGVNASITLLAIQGLTAYVEGNRRQAHEDFATVAEEIAARLG